MYTHPGDAEAADRRALQKMGYSDSEIPPNTITGKQLILFLVAMAILGVVCLIFR